ncbi:hypothetical protein GXW71_00730 [Roseomonas hellenica]|uniref:Uncharacterized protein n=1 Tax=Plastoroseomonas hellenica TaxID=2687306 RepID=A0ABS5ERF2_9PROT|nr:hypothetical protein [Plastoroseomonas hellenica]MBR0662868.1 hypothetical protein [Plastoroseomonas hellenica]
MYHGVLVALTPSILPAAPASLAEAEAYFLARRAGPPDAAAAGEAAMRWALGDALPAWPALLHAAQAIGAAVERHGAGFPPGAEPAYHDRHHQAEAGLAMGWLCGAARAAGLLSAEQAGIGVLAMAGHDLLHDGTETGPPGRLEAQSAAATAAIAAASGVVPATAALVHDLILSTEFTRPLGPELLPHLAREADLMGSLCPVLGWRLSEALAAERRAAGHPAPDHVASFAGRLGFLHILPTATPIGVGFGLEAAGRAQIAAFGRAAQRLGLIDTAPDAAAAALDRLPRDQARALYDAALAQSEGGA